MLNRTNRTLSANLNGLNLGTRSLAVTANINTGDLQTLRTRHVHRVVMRDGMHGYRAPSISNSIPISISGDANPFIPGSLPVPPSWPVASGVVRPWSELAAEMFTSTDRSWLCWMGDHDAFSATFQRSLFELQERSKRDRRPVVKGLRPRVEKRFGLTSARASLATGAATSAASGG